MRKNYRYYTYNSFLLGIYFAKGKIFEVKKMVMSSVSNEL